MHRNTFQQWLLSSCKIRNRKTVCSYILKYDKSASLSPAFASYNSWSSPLASHRWQSSIHLWLTYSDLQQCCMLKMRKYHWKIAAGIKPLNPELFPFIVEFLWDLWIIFFTLISNLFLFFSFGLVGWQAAYHCQHLLHCPLDYLLSSVLLIDFSVNTVYVPVIFFFLCNIKFRNILNCNLFPSIFESYFFLIPICLQVDNSNNGNSFPYKTLFLFMAQSSVAY